MKTYNVKVTDAALADMEEIYNYIAFTLLSPANAIAQYDRIAEAILSLNEFCRKRVRKFKKNAGR